MFHPMATTVVIALLSAMVLSVLFVPAGVAMLFRRPVKRRRNSLLIILRAIYSPVLRLALRLRWLVLVGAVGLVTGSAWQAMRLGVEFVPNLDEGDIAMHALRIPGTSLQQSIRQQTLLEERISAVPEVERVFAKIGTPEIATDAMPPSVADNFIMLKERDEWPNPTRMKSDIVRELEEIVSGVPGNRYEFLQPIQMRFNELIAGVRAELAVKVFGDDFF